MTQAPRKMAIILLLENKYFPYLLLKAKKKHAFHDFHTQPLKNSKSH